MSLPLVAAAFGLLFHFGGQEVRRFENLATADLASRLEGPSKRVSVKVKLGSLRLGHLSEAAIDASGFSTKTLPLWTEPQRSKQGIINRLTIRLSDFEIGGLPVERMDIELTNCRWDVSYAVKEGKIRLSRSGRGTFSARITSQGVSQFLKNRYPQIQPTSLHIDPYKIAASFEVGTPFGKLNLEMIATASIWKSSGLSLNPAYLAFNGRSLSADEQKGVLRLFQPAIDLDRDFGLAGALALEEIVLGAERMVLTGRAYIPEQPSEALQLR